ncbi:SDR family oxidoreductase [Mycoplasmatota bacterium]|nr:SDR family oxidoreductase [Mycoplasmatota bacterium]
MRAFITGASSGIGRELAFQLAELNYDLILVARRYERLEEIKKQITNRDVIIIQSDLNDPDQLSALFKQLKSYEIDLFINNAGFGKVGDSIEIDTSQEIKMIELNIISLHALTKFAIQHMHKGKIVNISSLAAYLPTPKLASYAATKSYVTNYSMALDYELKKLKVPIKVLSVAPGPIKTEFGKVAGVNQKMKGMDVKKCVKKMIKGIENNKKVIVPGFKMKLLKFILHFIPRRWVLASAYKIQNKK